MTKEWKSLTPNAKKVCVSDFFWNLGRTFPHAILTVFLLKQGYSLSQIATLQTIFMIVAMITEFPSGVVADLMQRKKVYLFSLATLILSYLLIFIFSDNFAVLCISYVLYGFSVSLKSGTLDADVTLELREKNIPIESYSIITSYFISTSSILGGLVGAFLYEYVKQSIYFIAIVIIFIAVLVSMTCHFSVTTRERKQDEKHVDLLVNELKEGYSAVKSNNILKCLIFIFAVSMLFVQPFLQYWQVLYDDNGIPEVYFGVIYLFFQLCNIVSTILFKYIKLDEKKIIINLMLIPVIYGVLCLTKYGPLVGLPIVVILFYMYDLYLEVALKKYAPKETISGFISLIGTIQNFASIGSLYVMVLFINIWGIKFAYLYVFLLFSILEIILHIVNKR